jgi:hypothetical protein
MSHSEKMELGFDEQGKPYPYPYENVGQTIDISDDDLPF